MRLMRWSFILVIVVASLIGVIAGCERNDDDDDDAAEKIIFSEDWESYTSGQTPDSPWIIEADGNATALIVDTDGGRALQLTADEGESVKVEWENDYELTDSTIVAEFDAALDADQLVSFYLSDGDGHGQAFAAFGEGNVFTADLEANTPTCGSYSSGEWVRITIEADPVNRLHTIKVNDEVADCADGKWVHQDLPESELKVFGIRIYSPFAGQARIDNLVIYKMPAKSEQALKSNYLSGEASAKSDDDDDDSYQDVDCFDDNGIKPDVDFCQYYGMDFIGKSAYKPEYWLVNNIFPKGFTYKAHNDWEGLIYGTDLGVNVNVNGTTYYFFGDTVPNNASSNSSSNSTLTGNTSGNPYGWDTDGDLHIDEFELDDSASYERYFTMLQGAAFDADGDPTGLLNEIEQNYMYPNGVSAGKEAVFWVPTGAAQVDGTKVYAWFGKYISNTLCDQNHLLSYDPSTHEWTYLSLFATRNLIQVNPIFVERNTKPPSNDSCELPWTEDNERGFVIYASGRPDDNTVSFEKADPSGGATCMKGSTPGYRKSGMYLAYVNLTDLEDPDVNSKIYYYTGNTNQCWMQGQPGKAQAIITDEHIGEFSAVQIPETDYILLMDSHQNLEQQFLSMIKDHFNQLRFTELDVMAANIAKPWNLTDPKEGAAYGYGNYLIESSLEFYDEIEIQPGMKEYNVLFFDRVISTWKGGTLDQILEYGTSIIYGLMDFSDFVEQLKQ